MRAWDTTNHGPMEKCGEHSQPWRRRRSAMEEKRGKNGKRGAERGREQVENEGREGTNGKMGWEGERTGCNR